MNEKIILEVNFEVRDLNDFTRIRLKSQISVVTE